MRSWFCGARPAAMSGLPRVEHLVQLGHRTMEKARYANLITEDLQAVHQRVSLLATK
jgi:hypothetical protein